MGLISLRFRAAWKTQGRSLDDLAYYRQPLFSLLPVATVVLSVAMFVALGYAVVDEKPFSARNIVETYIGPVLYVVIYFAYTLFEISWLKKTQHIVALMAVGDLDTDGVWQAGEGADPRAENAAEHRKRDEDEIANGRRLWVYMRRMRRYVV